MIEISSCGFSYYYYYIFILDEREITSFNAQTEANLDDSHEKRKYKSVRKMYGEDETVYIMDAKTCGNIGRFLNVI